MRARTLLLLLLLAGGRSARAQAIRPEPSAAAPFLASLGGGVVGTFGGALVGYGLNRDCPSDEMCGLFGMLLGGIAGEAVGVAFGAHLGNRHRGNFALDLLTASGVSALGITLAATDQPRAPAYLIGGAVIQLAATVAVERSTGRAREHRAATVSLVPMQGHRIAIAATMPLP